MIPPTVGRRVWYWPKKDEKVKSDHEQPFDAGIVHVNGDGTVNLDVKNEYGYPLTGKHHITLVESPDKAVPGQASWMPYQVKTAAA